MVVVCVTTHKRTPNFFPGIKHNVEMATMLGFCARYVSVVLGRAKKKKDGRSLNWLNHGEIRSERNGGGGRPKVPRNSQSRRTTWTVKKIRKKNWEWK
jgi:hypothetical protein